LQPRVKNQLHHLLMPAKLKLMIYELKLKL